MLNNLIEYVDNLENEGIEKFVYYLCDLKFEKNINLIFQQPFALKVIFPVLFKSIENRQMPQLRWLYQLEMYDPIAIERIEEKLGSDSKLAILQLANKIEPNDLQTVKLLLDYYLYFLWFGSHHMPEGILTNKIEVEQTKNEIQNLFSAYCNSGIIDDQLIRNYTYYVELYNDWFLFHNK